jgi:hypothetical protein
MKKLFGLFLCAFMLLYVACGEVDNVVTKLEHQSIGGIKYLDKFDFMKKIEHNNDRGARLYISMSSQPNHDKTLISCVLISRNSVQDTKVFNYTEETENFAIYLTEHVTNNLITEAEKEWLIKDYATLIESNRTIINPN